MKERQAADHGKHKWNEFGHIARRQFVREGKTVQQISDALGVGTTTLYAWRRDDEWEERRRKHLASTDAVLDRLDRGIIRLSERMENCEPTDLPGIIDSLAKATKTKRQLEGHDDLMDAVLQVSDDFLEFIRRRRPEELKRMADLMSEYLQDVARRAT